MPPDTDPSREFQERSFSLTDSLRAVASAAGAPPSRDDLHAAMGLPFMICVPEDNSISPSDWPLLARDVFLEDAGRIFGLGIRDVHPPEAAIGLDHTAAFRQHFEASYQPLIARALENDQHVLAWQGWLDEDEPLWGVIQRVDDDVPELGIAGGTGLALRDGLDACTPVALSEPPVQLYVVETIAAATPGASELWELIRRHARLALSNECAARFGVSTGPRAIDTWQARLSGLGEESEQITTAIDHHRTCAAEFAAGLSAMIRYARSAEGQLPATDQANLRTLTAASHKAATALTAMAGTTPASCQQDLKQLHRTFVKQLDGAKSALAEVQHTFSD